MLYNLLVVRAVYSDMTNFLRAGLAGISRLSSLPPYSISRHTDDTWEYVLYSDALQRLTYLTSYTSFQANQHMDDTSLLDLAYELTEELINTNIIYHPLVISKQILVAHDYRSFGVIYGQYSKLSKDRGHHDIAKACGIKMRSMWQRYLELNPTDEEIKRLMNTSINPYNGDTIPSPNNT